jgi:ABC-type multidrug transport system fused ATPase/permease subunit
VLGVISSAFILWYGGNQVLNGEISQGTFLAFLVALFMMYSPMRILFKIYTSVQTALAGAALLLLLTGFAGTQEAASADKAYRITPVAEDLDHPWNLTFSYGRALQAHAMQTWGGAPDAIESGSQAFLKRARCNSAATRGAWERSMEQATA